MQKKFLIIRYCKKNAMLSLCARDVYKWLYLFKNCLNMKLKRIFVNVKEEN